MSDETEKEFPKVQLFDEVDLSDEEDAETLDLSPFKVDWLDLSSVGCAQKLGICALPGCRFKSVWRSMSNDMACLKEMGVTDVFCTLTTGELSYFRASGLLKQYREAGIRCHHRPVDDGYVPPLADLLEMIEDITACLKAGKKTIIHCYGGLGRSCAVAACLMMVMDKNLSSEDAKKKIRDLKGEAAIQSVKQYNFVTDFRNILNDYIVADIENRAISR